MPVFPRFFRRPLLFSFCVIVSGDHSYARQNRAGTTITYDRSKTVLKDVYPCRHVDRRVYTFAEVAVDSADRILFHVVSRNIAFRVSGGAC